MQYSKFLSIYTYQIIQTLKKPSESDTNINKFKICIRSDSIWLFNSRGIIIVEFPITEYKLFIEYAKEVLINIYHFEDFSSLFI